jgi:hypothetical protein
MLQSLGGVAGDDDPVMNGSQLAVEAQRLRPGIKVLLTSGYVANLDEGQEGRRSRCAEPVGAACSHPFSALRRPAPSAGTVRVSLRVTSELAAQDVHFPKIRV